MNEAMDLRQYLAIGAKWWWLLALAIILAAVTGYTASRRQIPVYEATTTIIVGQSIQATELNSSDILTSERLARTYASIAQRQPVLQDVVERLSLSDGQSNPLLLKFLPKPIADLLQLKASSVPAWKALQKRVAARPVRDTQLLEITVEAPSPEEAQITADEVANQLILLSPTALENQANDENQQFVRHRLENLEAKIEAGQEHLTILEATMSGSLSAEQVQAMQTEINDLENLVAGWEDSYTQLILFIEAKKSPNYLAIVEPAQIDLNPIRPRILLNTLLASVVGFLLALGVVLLVEHLDDTLKSTDELSQILGLAALGAIGHIKGRYYQDKLITTQDPFSPVVEAYRMLRSNIQFVSVNRPATTIMITSPAPNEGKSITTANLAVVIAQAGLKTIIVDADLRRPMQSEIFQMPNLAGLSDILRSAEFDPNSHLRKTQIENLQVMTSGILPPNPSELLSSQRMEQVLASLTELADVIILDSSPATTVTDASVLATKVDGVVLVIQAHQTSLGAIRQAILNLQQADANIFGGVLNRVSAKRRGYYYQSYYASPNSRWARQPSQIGVQQARVRRRWQWLPFVK